MKNQKQGYWYCGCCYFVLVSCKYEESKARLLVLWLISTALCT